MPSKEFRSALFLSPNTPAQSGIRNLHAADILARRGKIIAVDNIRRVDWPFAS